MYTMGLDIGSTASKCLVLKDGQTIVGQAAVPVGAGTSGPKRAIEKVLTEVGITIDQVVATVATGYGRHTMKQADKQVSELSCHAKGAYFLFPNISTLIDIGGQDAKALQIGPDGKILNFVMNDKCAAGTGRFLDVMARVLEVPVERMGEEGEKSTQQVEISSTCTVFAESEVISHLSKEEAICDIINGIHRSIARRVSSLVKRIKVCDEVVITGGVAQNRGVVKALEEELKVSIQSSPLAQLNGALGAALFAYDLAIKAVPEKN